MRCRSPSTGRPPGSPSGPPQRSAGGASRPAARCRISAGRHGSPVGHVEVEEPCPAAPRITAHRLRVSAAQRPRHVIALGQRTWRHPDVSCQAGRRHPRTRPRRSRSPPATAATTRWSRCVPAARQAGPAVREGEPNLSAGTCPERGSRSTSRLMASSSSGTRWISRSSAGRHAGRRR